MQIRDYQHSDLNTIINIYNLSKLDELRFEQRTFSLLPLTQDQQRFASLKQSTIFVYETDKVVAYGAHQGSVISALFVHPDARGKGFGKQLLEHLLNNINDTTRLYVAKSNWPAKALYQDYGFVVRDTFQTSYNGVAVIANEMLRSVKPHA